MQTDLCTEQPFCAVTSGHIIIVMLVTVKVALTMCNFILARIYTVSKRQEMKGT